MAEQKDTVAGLIEDRLDSINTSLGYCMGRRENYIEGIGELATEITVLEAERDELLQFLELHRQSGNQGS